MKKIDTIGTELCKYQADLFELASLKGVPSNLFINKFSKSDLAQRMDKTGFLFESRDTENAFEELEISTKKKGEIYPTYVMSWIGYLYRYWAYTYEISSLDISKIFDLSKLYGLYQAYHSMDVEEAISRIYESSVNTALNDVKLMEKIRKV